MSYEFVAISLALLFTGGFMAAITTTTMRALNYRRRGHALPRLLIRDLWVFGGFATTITLIMLVRALDLGDVVRGEVWWLLLSTLPSLVGVLVYDFYEIAVIDRVEPGPRE